jgi:hypothetical protein
MNFLTLRLPNIKSLSLSVSLIAAILAGCGGGGGGGSSSAASVLSGVAAVGAPIVNGDIQLVCATGASLSGVKTGSMGGWQVTLSGRTLPCAAQVSGGTINGSVNTTSYHSVATSAGTVNITPLTDLLVANLAGTANPSTWFTGLGVNSSALTTVTKAQVDTAITNLNAAFPTLPIYTVTNNPVTSSFTPVAGNGHDDMLSALRTSMSSSSVSYATLLGSAALGSSFTPPSGLTTALTTAYQATTSGTGAVYFPVNNAITTFNASPLIFSLAGTYLGRSVVISYETSRATSVTSFLPPDASLGLKQASGFYLNSRTYIDGVQTDSRTGITFFTAAPYKNIGYEGNGITVYDNQVALPSMARIGASGNFDTGIDYYGPTTLGTFIETWSLVAGSTSNTAVLCINSTMTAIAASAISGNASYCLTIDTSGSILEIKLTGPIDISGTKLTLTSTSITTPSP